MKILYLNIYKWLLSQNQREENDFFDYRRYEALAKYIKSFFKKNINATGRQSPDCYSGIHERLLFHVFFRYKYYFYTLILNLKDNFFFF